MLGWRVAGGLVRMNSKRTRFVDALLIEPSATAAAISAGYAPRSAASQASELLKNPEVSTALALKRAELAARSGVSADLIVSGLLEEAQRMSPDGTAGARVAAWVALAKLLGMTETARPAAPPVVNISLIAPRSS